MYCYRDRVSRHGDTLVSPYEGHQAGNPINSEKTGLAPQLYSPQCEPDCYQKRIKPSHCEGTFFGQRKAKR